MACGRPGGVATWPLAPGMQGPGAGIRPWGRLAIGPALGAAAVRAGAPRCPTPRLAFYGALAMATAIDQLGLARTREGALDHHRLPRSWLRRIAGWCWAQHTSGPRCRVRAVRVLISRAPFAKRRPTRPSSSWSRTRPFAAAAPPAAVLPERGASRHTVRHCGQSATAKWFPLSAHQIDHAERKAKRRSTFILEIS